MFNDVLLHATKLGQILPRTHGSLVNASFDKAATDPDPTFTYVKDCANYTTYIDSQKT